jgi:predicted lipoprotein with Yx(FWY)xxD motif
VTVAVSVAVLILAVSLGSQTVPPTTKPPAPAPRAVAADMASAGPDDAEDVKAPPPVTVGLGAATFGQRMKDQHGMTMYVFSADSRRHSVCVEECARVWPPVRSDGGKPQPTTATRADQIGSVQRDDGSDQVTFRGHPVYYHAEDSRPGQTTGHGRTQFGGHWSAIPPRVAAQIPSSGMR